MMEQRSIEWFRERLGKITGSMVGQLMKKGRGNSPFSQTAMKYIYQIAAERTMNSELVRNDEQFAAYLEQVDVTTKAMRWGTEQEMFARNLLSEVTMEYIEEVGSVSHPSIPHFASSPDGVIKDEDGKIRCCVEIKCPNQNTFMMYVNEVHSAKELLDVNSDYYYQCMAHMMCTGAKNCIFMVYNPYQQIPYHTVEISEDKEAFEEVAAAIEKANKLITDITTRQDELHW